MVAVLHYAVGRDRRRHRPAFLLASEQFVRFAVINDFGTHLMHRLRGWLRTLDEILGTAVAAIRELSGAAVNIDRDNARRRR